MFDWDYTVVFVLTGVFYWRGYRLSFFKPGTETFIHRFTFAVLLAVLMSLGAVYSPWTQARLSEMVGILLIILGLALMGGSVRQISRSVEAGGWTKMLKAQFRWIILGSMVMIIVTAAAIWASRVRLSFSIQPLMDWLYARFGEYDFIRELQNYISSHSYQPDYSSGGKDDFVGHIPRNGFNLDQFNLGIHLTPMWIITIRVLSILFFCLALWYWLRPTYNNQELETDNYTKRKIFNKDHKRMRDRIFQKWGNHLLERLHHPVRRAYRQLLIILLTQDYARQSHETPIEFQQRMKQIEPEWKDSLEYITITYNDVKYGVENEIDSKQFFQHIKWIKQSLKNKNL